MYRILLPLLLTMSLGSLEGDDFTPRIFTGPDGKTLPYELHIPKNYDKNQKYPVVLFFHGAGERGTDNKVQLNNGMTVFSSSDQFPCFVIAPQCPPTDGWVNVNWSAPSSVRPPDPSPSMQLALKILDQVSSEFSIDPDRVYLAGLSMGGYAVWDCITRFPDRFAAGVLTCGGGGRKNGHPGHGQGAGLGFSFLGRPNCSRRAGSKHDQGHERRGRPSPLYRI